MHLARAAIPYVALIAMTLAAYGPVWRHDFVDFDDEHYITQNPRVIQGLTGENIVWAWSNFHGKYWQPLSWLSLQWDAHWFSTRTPEGPIALSATAYHGQNLFWHIASACLLFALWRRLIGNDGCSFMVAMLFAVHPMHVESVAWAAERKDVLSVFFGILTVIMYVGYLRGGSRKSYLAMLAAYSASLLSKPMLITLPFVLLLLDYWPLGRMFVRVPAATESPARAANLRQLLLEKAPLFALAAIIAVVTWSAREETGAAVSLAELSVTARVANAVNAFGWYLASTFWPADLTVLYLHPRENWSLAGALAGGAVLMIVTGLAIWQARRRPWLIVGWLWFLGSLIPVIGLTQGGMQAWADRFSYWPHIGLFLVLVFAVAEFLARARMPAAIGWSAATIILLGLVTVTWTQVTHWQNTETLWNRALALDPENHRAHYYLGAFFQRQGQLDVSRRHAAEAVKLSPDYVEYYRLAGEVAMSLGLFADAAEHFFEILRRDSSDADAWYNLGLARLRQGKTENASRCFHKVLDLQPGSADARTGLGLAWWREGKRQQALEAFALAVRMNPREAEAWHGLGRGSLAQGDLLKAREHFTRALQIKPQFPKALSDIGVTLDHLNDRQQAVSCHLAAVQLAEQHDKSIASMGGVVSFPDSLALVVVFRCRLATSLNQMGETEAAKMQYLAALEHDPDWPTKFTLKAWWLATHADESVRDASQAYELATQAIQGAGNPTVAMLDALSAANAALGYFQQAARTARQAHDLAAATGELHRRDAIRQRLLLYEKGKAYVDHDSSDEPFSTH